MSKDIKKKLLEIAQEKVEQKLKEEREKEEARINGEIDKVKFILELIDKKMLYKRIGDWRDYKYEMITQEIFFEDYSKEPKNTYDKKLEIKDLDWNLDNYHLQIEVNGIKYYHIGSLIKDFEEQLKKKTERINYITEGLYDLENEFKELVKQEKMIKSFIEDYNTIAQKIKE